MAELRKSIITRLKRIELIRKAYEAYYYNKYLSLINPKQDTWYLDFFNYASGDVYMGCSLLYAFKKKYNKDRVTVLLHKDKFVEIVKLFDIDVEVKLVNMPLPRYKQFTEFKRGVIIDLHPAPFMKHVLQILGHKGIDILDLFKVLYTLPFSTQPDYPVNGHNADTSYVARLFNNLNLEKGNTVILAPEAVTIDEINISFWKQLIVKLQPHFNLVLMSFSNVYDTLNIPKISFSYQYAIAAVNYAGYLISLRSGFCDIISTAAATKIILYPHIIWGGGTFLRCATIQQLNPKGNDNLFELEYGVEDDDNLINKMLKTLKND